MTAPKYVTCIECKGTGDAAEGFYCYACGGSGELLCCAECGDAIGGCIWQGGLCLWCHEGTLLPESALDRWEAEYAL
jgi:RecJ-like exonuclease